RGPSAAASRSASARRRRRSRRRTVASPTSGSRPAARDDGGWWIRGVASRTSLSTSRRLRPSGSLGESLRAPYRKPSCYTDQDRERGGEPGDPGRQNAAVDARRVEIGRTRRVEQRVRRVRVEHVEYVDAGAELPADKAEILRHLDVEHVERR